METYAPLKSARTWDSYRYTLDRILGHFNPLSVLEFGPGESTKIMYDYPTVTLIDSIEHDEAWAANVKGLENKVKVYNEASEFKYPYVSGRLDHYDLIFVDGIKRPECLGVAKFRIKPDGIVILHDAERPDYKQAIGLYGFRFFEDDGHTVVLTDCEQTAMSISEAL